MENEPQEINIEERSTIYDVSMTYHSDMACANYDAKIIAIMEADGKISIKPKGEYNWSSSFVFDHSDPDRVLAIANMIKSFAEMAKKENKMLKTTIDISKTI